MGEKYVQEEFLGEESLGEKYMGEMYVQEEFLGEESLGEKYMGEKYVEEKKLGEESLCEKYGWKVCARRVSGWKISGWKVYGWNVLKSLWVKSMVENRGRWDAGFRSPLLRYSTYYIDYIVDFHGFSIATIDYRRDMICNDI